MGSKTDIVTLLFTDIESSSRLWETDADGMSRALAAHDTLARCAVEANRGRVAKMTGDGMYAVFESPLDALAATIRLQRDIADPAATGGIALRVRCGLHVDQVERRGEDYFGPAVNRAARIMSAAHGGQVLLSHAIAERIRDDLPEAVALLDLGKLRLKDLVTPEHVYQVVHPELRRQFPALRSLEAVPNNLPEQLTSFVGRVQALDELGRLLRRVRLLTLTGSGGCGKTRLALQVATDALERFPDGVWLVELATVSDAGLVARTAATVLGLKEEPGKPPIETLTAHLRDRRLLLVLDNCEHLLDACARLAGTVLRQCRDVTIITSSREALGIAGEQAYRVPSLSVPDADATIAALASCESVQLFVDRAMLVRPGFQLSAGDAAMVGSICVRLDGIPLAIEMAAARMRSLSLEDIHGKLDQRFRLLTGGSRTALPRQQTLRALIDWSYDLLHDGEKCVLQRLSVFAGGWTLQGAERVCASEDVAEADVLDLLTSLDDKSLVTSDQASGATRYRMLETVRQYAREKLLQGGDGEATRRRHCDYFVSLAEQAQPKLVSDEQGRWLERLAEEHDNLRAALTWSADARQWPVTLRLCNALEMFWVIRGFFSEGRAWYARVLEASSREASSPERGKAFSAAGSLAFYQADYAAAKALHEESLKVWRALGNRRMIASTLGNVGHVVKEQGDAPGARVLYEECLAVMREVGDPRGIAGALNSLGNVANEQGDFPAARRLYEECLRIAEDLAEPRGLGIVLHNLGTVAYAQGDLVGAWELLERSLVLRRSVGDRWGIASSLNNLGEVACAQGHFDTAVTQHREGLAIARALGDRRMIAYSLEGIAAVAGARGDAARAACLWGASARLREDVGWPLEAAERARHDERVARARMASRDDAFELQWDRGRALALDRVVQVALGGSVSSLGEEAP